MWTPLLIMFIFINNSLATENNLKLITQYLQARSWNHIYILHNKQTDILSQHEVLQLMQRQAKISSYVVIDVSRSPILVEKDSGRVSKFPIVLPGGSYVYLNKNNYLMQFLVLWDSYNVLQFMKQAINYFTTQQEWLVILPSNSTMESFLQQTKDLPIFLDSEVIVVEGAGKSRNLHEIWRIGIDSGYKQALRGTWSDSKLSLLKLPHKYDRRSDMEGYFLRVATIKTMPYESLHGEGFPQNFKSGYVVDVFHTIQQRLNFTYSATNTLFGSLQPDGVTWNGMVGMLQDRTADVAAAPLSITHIRSFAIDFTIPVQMVSTRLYIRRPVLEATWTLYFLPFDKYLWICVPCSILASAIFMWMLNEIALLTGVTDHDISLSENLWAMFSSITQQATIVEPEPFSCKLMFFTGFAVNMVLYTCYAGVLVSILTTMQPRLPFKDFEDLQNRPDWNLGVRTNTALADSLALAPKDSPMRLAWEKFVGKDPEKNLPTNNDDALESVLNGKYAFFANKEYIIYRLQSVLPLEQAMEIVDTNTDFLKRGIGFGLQKGSPFRNIFNHVLSKMTQSGHIDRLKKKWWPNIDREPERPYPSPGFQEVFTVFLVWGAVSLLAFGIFVLEKLSASRLHIQNY